MSFKSFSSQRAASLVEYVSAIAIVFVMLAAGLGNLSQILKRSNEAATSTQPLGPCGDLLGPDDCK